MTSSFSRRELIGWIMVAGAGLIPPTLSRQAVAAEARKEDGPTDEEMVTPGEDLMREHGVLRRVFLVYEECSRRLEAPEEVSSEILTSAASIIRRVIEDYHEKLEEDYLFPRFEKADKLTELVGTLRAQHQGGRRLTDAIQRLATAEGLKDEDSRRQIRQSVRSFIRMYRPHAAREDTVLFPAFHSVVSRQEYGDLGEVFEDKEHELFGEEGFERIVEEVAALERVLGIYDLAQFTARP